MMVQKGECFVRTLLFCLCVIRLLLALPARSPEEDWTLVLPTGSEQGLYQLWLCDREGETLIRNNLVPDDTGQILVEHLPQPAPDQRYEFRMIGAGEGQIFDPAPREGTLFNALFTPGDL